MDDFTQLASVEAVLDRARKCLSHEELPNLVMNDPGHAGYVAAYELVLAGGAVELLGDYDGTRLLDSFDITDNLGHYHFDASPSPSHRWFSVLTACIELLRWDEMNGIPASESLYRLMADSFALHATGDARAPLDLLPQLFRELQQACGNRHLYVAALLCELLVADLSDADVEAECRELHRCHENFQQAYVEGEEENEWLPNQWYAKRPEFIWGAVLTYRREQRMWLELVKTHFPSSPKLAHETRERLLLDGETWTRTRGRK